MNHESIIEMVGLSRSISKLTLNYLFERTHLYELYCVQRHRYITSQIKLCALISWANTIKRKNNKENKMKWKSRFINAIKCVGPTVKGNSTKTNETSTARMDARIELHTQIIFAKFTISVSPVYSNRIKII